MGVLIQLEQACLVLCEGINTQMEDQVPCQSVLGLSPKQCLNVSLCHVIVGLFSS